MTNLQFNIKNELKFIDHFHKIDNPIAVVSNKRDHDIRKDLMNIATDARQFGIAKRCVKSNISKWENVDVKNMVNFYRVHGLKDATIINYVSSLRSFLHETGRTNITASNYELGLKRIIEYKDKSLSAKGVDINEKLQYFKEKDVNVYTQLKLASISGLRREEAIHAGLAIFKGYDIVKDNKLILKGSWCKNGRAREIALSDEKIKEIKELQKYVMNNKYRMDRNLKQEKKHLSNSIERAGFNMHAVRHSVAQETYTELKNEGFTEKEAKTAVSQELGHGAGRSDITNIYLCKK